MVKIAFSSAGESWSNGLVRLTKRPLILDSNWDKRVIQSIRSCAEGGLVIERIVEDTHKEKVVVDGDIGVVDKATAKKLEAMTVKRVTVGDISEEEMYAEIDKQAKEDAAAADEEEREKRKAKQKEHDDVFLETVKKITEEREKRNGGKSVKQMSKPPKKKKAEGEGV